jgi:CheY-like chemotaxis protein
MPHMDGDEAFHAIRELRPAARVLLMSGFNEQEAIARFAGKGLAGFIQKPFAFPALRGKLQEIFSADVVSV